MTENRRRTSGVVDCRFVCHKRNKSRQVLIELAEQLRRQIINRDLQSQMPGSFANQIIRLTTDLDLLQLLIDSAQQQLMEIMSHEDDRSCSDSDKEGGEP